MITLLVAEEVFDLVEESDDMQAEEATTSMYRDEARIAVLLRQRREQRQCALGMDGKPSMPAVKLHRKRHLQVHRRSGIQLTPCQA
eukprot:767857-Hanusia_phi.AAC.3